MDSVPPSKLFPGNPAFRILSFFISILIMDGILQNPIYVPISSSQHLRQFSAIGFSCTLFEQLDGTLIKPGQPACPHPSFFFLASDSNIRWCSHSAGLPPQNMQISLCSLLMKQYPAYTTPTSHTMRADDGVTHNRIASVLQQSLQFLHQPYPGN